MLTTIASTCCCISLSVTVRPTPKCPTPKAHLSHTCKYFSAPENYFVHLKINHPGFQHPRSLQKVPYSASGVVPVQSMSNCLRNLYLIVFCCVSILLCNSLETSQGLTFSECYFSEYVNCLIHNCLKCLHLLGILKRIKLIFVP